MMPVTRAKLLKQRTDGDGYIWRHRALEVAKKVRAESIDWLIEKAAHIYYEHKSLKYRQKMARLATHRFHKPFQKKYKHKGPCVLTCVRALVAYLLNFKGPVHLALV